MGFFKNLLPKTFGGEKTWRDTLSNPLNIGGKNSKFAKAAHWLADPLNTGLWDLVDKPEYTGPDPNEYLNKIPGILNETYDPYRQQAEQVYPELANSYNMMASDPTGYMQGMMNKFQESPQYQQQFNDILKGSQVASQAGGYKNSQMGQGDLSSILASNDMQQWLKNATDVQGSGLSGLQGIYDTGFDASSALSSDMANLMGSKASLDFSRQSNQNQGRADRGNALLQAGGAAAGAYFGRNKGDDSIISSGESPSKYSLYPDRAYDPMSRYSLYGRR